MKRGFRTWLAIVALAVVCQAAVDLWLLPQRLDLISGEVMGWRRISTLQALGLFLAGALPGTVAVAGVLTLCGLGLARAVRLRPRAAIGLGLAAAIVPPLAISIGTRELLHYVGDLADVPVLFALAGLREVVAVSGPSLVRPVLLATLVFAGVTLLIWQLHRGERTAVVAGPMDLKPLVAAVLASLLAAAAHVALRAASERVDFAVSWTAAGRMIGLATRQLTDVDRDGYGLLQRPSDTALFDPAIRPYALDLPGNHIDEDGILGDLPLTVPVYQEAPPPSGRWARRPDVLFVLLESVRADAVGSHLDGRPVTPQLDAIAADGVFTRDMWSHNGFTTQSRRHLFSGSIAGLRGATTLVDDFRQQGYQIGYFSGQDDDFGGGDVGRSRADVAFHASDAPAAHALLAGPGSPTVPLQDIEPRVGAFLRTRDRTRPLFLYVSLGDTHFPYHHGQIVPLVDSTVVAQSDLAPERAGEIRRMYLNTLANVDAAIGRIARLARAATLDRLAVIVTSDHGESLFDGDGLGHGSVPGGVQTQVPLIVSGLPMAIALPFGQSDLRDAIWEAMTVGEEGRPHLTGRQGAVLQYVGTLDAPPKIAAISSQGSVVYDFRAARVRFNQGAWERLDALAGDRATVAASLIHTWERLRLAQAAGVN